MSHTETNIYSDGLKDVMGMVNTYMSAAAIPAVDEQLILRAWNWFEELLKKDQKQSAGAFVLIEVMQPVSLSILSSIFKHLTKYAARISICKIRIRACLAQYLLSTHAPVGHRSKTWRAFIR